MLSHIDKDVRATHYNVDHSQQAYLDNHRHALQAYDFGRILHQDRGHTADYDGGRC